MGNLGQTFSRDKMPEATSFSPLPVGDYVCAIKSTAVKPTKAGDGQYIKLEMEVAQGDYTGRKVFTQITFQHPNEMTVEIGLKNLNKLCECAGLQNISDSDQLVGSICAVNLVISKDQNGGDRNEVKYYMLPTEAKPSPTKAGQKAQAQPNMMAAPTPPAQPAMGFAPQPTSAPTAPLSSAPIQYQQPVAQQPVAPQMQYQPNGLAQPEQYQQPVQPQAAPPAMQYQTQPPVQPTQPATAPMVSNVIDDEIPF